MHPTYKHLEDRIRLAGLTITQWSQLVVCALAAYGLAKGLPLPGTWPVSIAITLAGLPAAASIALMQQDFDVALLARAAWHNQRRPVLYLPASDGDSSGPAHAGWAPGDWGALWD